MPQPASERLLSDGVPRSQSYPSSRESSPGGVELGIAFPVACSFSDGEACIDSSGSFETRPRWHDESVSPTCSLCRLAQAPRPIKILGSDIVGARLVGENGFSVWHAPCPNPSQPHKKRKLMKTPVFACQYPAVARQAIFLLQKLNCGWGRETPPQLLVFINPVSGSGRSKSIWTRECLPILEAAGVSLQTVETQGVKHATHEVEHADLANIDAIACAGGDGTMSEIVQGLFQRADWENAIKTPLCLIPAGTGNGMSASAGLWNPVTAAHALCKGRLRKMDVLSVMQPPGRRYFSFLSITFGFIANVDIGTEHLRWMGLLRNQVGAALEILKSKEHLARVAFVPAAHRPRSEGASAIQTPLLDRLGRLEDFKNLSEAVLPQGWKKIDLTSFSLFAVSVMPHLALDFSLVPTEQVDSGEMTLTYLPGNMTQCEGLQVMLKADAGKISEVEKLGLEKIAAFILEPVSKGTWIVMDGEVLPYERIFAELHPGICTLIVAP